MGQVVVKDRRYVYVWVQIDRGSVWTPLHIPTDKASRGVGVMRIFS